MIDRRNLLHGGLLGAATLFAPRIAFAAAPTDKRFIFIIQRGAADGLGIVVPVGDPAFAGQRGILGKVAQGGLKLDSTFTLHPALAQIGALYGSRQALFAHAIASPYRERSHFDGQNVLESGGSGPYAVKDGWLNRLLSLLPKADARAMAIAATIPLALRGSRDVASYAPSNLPQASDDMIERVSMLYQRDVQLHGLWDQALATRLLTGDLSAENGRNAAATGELCARLVAPVNGARVAMIETGGWDTHAGQNPRLAGQLRGLDVMVDAIRTGLGAEWVNTMVLVATEFGRTVAVNGTGGTDHGTAASAMLMGGSVKGGRVIADWPGLAIASLHEARDLRPTADLDSFIAGAVAAHFQLDPVRTRRVLFPMAQTGRAVEGLA
ncbi:hypothetical protein ASE75_01230 [Sphingomonas sp. Leaf17]|uniref:DUF1501 domain-containing protein n=1 Tax=Sphingomonas sp. Leaf17 TaxID=1735683 RepID=UPI0006FCDCE4|nr:DUF1501 domain-containing protein [Sphingomonas sp. Leaf17]KQM67588.1 hypothetical protein ASE75_01230 [Sphingomonas sp. Leaf17]